MEDRTALVVGGAGGIGSAVCQRLASEGYKLFVADVDLSRASEVVASLEGDGHSAVRIDAGSYEDVDARFDEIEKLSPAAVLVVLVGGVVLSDPMLPTIAEMPLDRWDAEIKLNLSSMFYCLKKFAQLRQAKPLENGRVVLFSSGAGQIAGSKTDIAYISGKAGVIGMTREAALEFGGYNCTVNAIAPGQIATPAFYAGMSEEGEAAIRAMTVLKRIGKPEEIAHGVSFLVALGGANITGHTLDINGGAVMR